MTGRIVKNINTAVGALKRATKARPRKKARKLAASSTKRTISKTTRALKPRARKAVRVRKVTRTTRHAPLARAA